MRKIEVKSYYNDMRLDNACAVVTNRQWLELQDKLHDAEFAGRALEARSVVYTSDIREWMLSLLSNDRIFNSKA